MDLDKASPVQSYFESDLIFFMEKQGDPPKL